MITLRQREVLGMIVDEYIKSARPIASKLLVEKYSLSISPSMVRLEMQALAQRGYLEQPYTSAGRIPSSKAYRLLLDEIQNGADGIDQNLVREIEKVASDVFQLLKILTQNLARASSNLALAHLVERDFFWKEGWDKVLQNSEFRDFDFAADFFKMVKDFEEKVRQLNPKNQRPQAYIGQENPLFKSDDFGLIITNCSFPPHGEKGRLAILGPKRMSYTKNIRLLGSLTDIFHD